MKILGLFILILYATSSYAAHTANATGTITWITIYNDNLIYFSLNPMPSDHGCAQNYFVIDTVLDSEARARYYSMLLAARTTQVSVTVGYDKITPTCVNTRPKVEALTY